MTIFSQSLFILLGIIPFIILRYYPFWNTLRLRHKDFLIIYSLILSSEIYFFLSIHSNHNFFFIEDRILVKLIFTCIDFFASCFIIKRYFFKHFFIWNLAALFAITMYTPIFYTLLSSENYYNFLINDIILFSVSIPFLFIGISVYKKFISNILAKSDSNNFVLFSLVLFAILILDITISLGLVIVKCHFIYLILTRIIAFLGTIICCKIFINIIKSQDTISELSSRYNEQEKFLNLTKTQYRELLNQTEEIRRMKHDMKHHFIAIYSLLVSKNDDAAISYIENEKDNLKSFDISCFSENYNINLILSYFKNRCNEFNIDYEITVDVPGKISISDLDLWILLGNILENALEASEILPENKKIKVSIIYKSSFIVINVSNFFDMNNINKKGDKFISSKNSISSGRGIESIISIVKKYNGLYTFETCDNLFLVSVILELSFTL